MVIGARKLKKFSVLRISAFILLTLVGGASASCGNKPRAVAVSAEIVRSGRTLTPTGFKYEDHTPTISADGSRVVFVSGRDTSDSQPMLKAYKADWAAAQSPGALARVTTSDIGYEREAVISADGSWVLLAALKNNQVDVYLQPFVGQAEALAVTSNGDVETQLAFSPDGKLISFLSVDPATGATAVKVAAIGSGGLQDLSNIRNLTIGEDHVEQLFWLPMPAGSSAPYQLVTASASATVSGASDFKKYAFTNLGSVSSSRPAVWLEGLRTNTEVAPALSSTVAVFAESVTAVDAVVPQIGTGATQNPKVTVPLRMAPVFVDLTANDILSRYGYTQSTANPAPGYSVRSLALSSDGMAALAVVGVYYRCSWDPAGIFGTSFVWAPKDTTQPVSFLNPKLALPNGDASSKVEEAYEFSANDLCGSRPVSNQVPARIDDQIVSATMSSKATTESYRVVYVTRATTMLDSSCGIVAGDTEVWALDVSPNEKKFYPISKNHDPALTTGNTIKQGNCHI